MTKRNDRGQMTRQHIIDVATDLFTQAGYEATSIEQVLQACGISKGALYHHFAGKVELFTAVLEATEQHVATRLSAASEGKTNPLDALRAGCAAWLSMARDPTVRQVVLLDAPSAVGWQAWREIDDRHGLGLLKMALMAAAAEGRFSADLVDIHAHMLLAVLIEMSLLIARAGDDDAQAAVRRGQVSVELVLSRVMGVEPNAAW
ncbi:MAG: TetR/AcrR family transcriptional regulator [Aquabacterium sp.]